jgi:UDP-N-acetylglucosamine 2-epimerase (non-hydrolysing)
MTYQRNLKNYTHPETMNKIKVAVVFGTRPEAIKLVPVIKKLSSHRQFQVITIVTAQHRQMLDQVLDLFAIQPKHDLGIMVKNQSLAQIVSNSIERLDQLLNQTRPDLVLVQGDTSTTFVASLAAFYNRIPVGHVEAGLRTRDRFQPFPEEINRRLTSVITDFHFAPTEMARDNLLAEGADPETVFVTGNTVIDAFQLALQTRNTSGELRLPKQLAKKKLIFVTAHRRENQGRPMKSVCQALREIVQQHPEAAVVFPVHYNPKVRDVVFPMLSKVDRVWLADPFGYIDTARMIQRSTLVLTDSGGIQEEAPSQGKPVLIMRNTTERPEGIHAGTAKLVGTNKTKIVREVCTLLSDPEKYEAMANAVNPYGDGKASERIAELILYAFRKRRVKPSPFAMRQTDGNS